MPAIRYSCHYQKSREGEQFVPDHALSYIQAGETMISDTEGTRVFTSGDLYFLRRNHLAKFQKTPPENGDYKSIAILFPQELLRNFSLKYGYSSRQKTAWPAFMPLTSQPVLVNYMESLTEYETLLGKPGSEALLLLKQEEALLLLLRLHPEFADILFDFTEPGKIDLEAFMNKNFHFNVSLERFAYLTGRSISTFKRDFEKIFSITPSRWLQKRRLEEAYYLLKEKHKSVSEIYLDLGFEDLSHFSFAFKKQYGVAPSLVA